MTVLNSSRNDFRGSLWHRWDLHFHTPASFDYEDKTITNEQIVERLKKEEIAVIGITDHHTIDIQRIRKLQELAEGQITILPGIEFRDEHGDKPIHYICIFPEDCDLDDIWTKLQGQLGLTPTDIRNKGGDEKIYVSIKDGARIAEKLGGIVSIHAGAKSNSIESISNKEQFQQRIKYDITNKYVNLLEIGQIKDIDRYLNIVFPATGLSKPLIICSDNHNVNNYHVKVPLWLKADLTFRGLLMAIREPFDRIFLGDRPPQLARVEKNQTKYIKGILFNHRGESALPSGGWFSGSLLFNHGLVAIVGNKGSGKSALADTLGLCGSTKNADGFSFLCEKRFRHPKIGHATHFEATLEWESGEKITRCLNDTIKAEEVELVKFLPQDHVEHICNELTEIGEDDFEQELKAVIFSHVPDVKRLGFRTLDKLVQFKTEEKQKRIDFLSKQLRDLNRVRSDMELDNDPKVRQSILEQIKQREIELKVHENTKPVEVPNPGKKEADGSLLTDISEAEKNKKVIGQRISEVTQTISVAERHLAITTRIVEKLNNLKNEFNIVQTELDTDAKEISLQTKDLLNLTINLQPVEEIKKQAQKTIEDNSKLLADVYKSGQKIGLYQQLDEIESKISALKLMLDAPNRAYQAYLKELEDWNAQGANIVGTDKDPETLNGLKKALSMLDTLPSKIGEVKDRQVKLALQIHSEKLAQSSIYSELYGPVQNFIDTHELAKDLLKLEFRVELINENFTDQLLDLLALNRRGSFMGINEGRLKSDSFIKVANWDDAESLKTFLQNIDEALHFDQRDQNPPPTQLKDQVVKGVNPAEVFNLLYGLDYIRPKYILRWEGKDLPMLSPGERGTLLLVFYLLIEKGDMPLVIDQPEGNLDNQTVAKVLIDCIKTARLKRQVFIVTHNPNLAVVCDSDQVIYASMDKSNGNIITYTAGSLENPKMIVHVTDVLEGTRWAFNKRDEAYEVAER
jgi:energy-coupling factor transporter ATP-binding protein EcfA2